MEIPVKAQKQNWNPAQLKIVVTTLVTFKLGAVGPVVVNNAVWVVRDKDPEVIRQVKVKISLVKKCLEKLSRALKKCVLTNSTDWISSKWNSHL